MTNLPNYQASIAVIGAGSSGITALKNLVAAGFTNVICYEKGSEVGGNWVYSPHESHSSVFATTHIISSKTLSEFPDFKMPADYPDYPSHTQIKNYFQNYAQHFNLYPYIKFNTAVQKAEYEPNSNTWQLMLSDGTTKQYNYLCVANGHHSVPLLPKYEGTFTGEFLHSHSFKVAEPFKNKKVLVIGGGNSACDVAVETARVSAFTAISMRRGYYIIPKFMFGGMPADVLHARLLFLPRWLRMRLLTLGHRLAIGRMTDYDFLPPKDNIMASHPTANSELLYFIRHGKVAVRRDIKLIDGNTVHFTNGIAEQYDTIIACTGYKITFPFFDKSVVDFSKSVPLYLKVFSPTYNNLFFVGLVQPMGCIWPLAHAQSQLVAEYIKGNYVLPKNMPKLIDKEIKIIRQRYKKTPRHLVEVEYHEYLEKLQKELLKK